MDRLRAAPALGGNFPAAALRPDVCAQFLASARRRDRPRMEPAKLRQALPESGLSGSIVPHHANRRGCHASLPATRISARLLHVFPRRGAQGSALSTRDRSPLGELSRPRLRLENDSWIRGRAQRFSAIYSSDEGTRRFFPI